MQINKTAENKYSTKFYFNDESYLANEYSYAIPTQKNPVWSPYDSTPQINNLARYTKNGYS
jgi:hypothetical protein